MTKVWLITGSGNGLGRSIAEAVLAAGNRVVATARNPAQLRDLEETYGDSIRVLALDVRDETQGQAAVKLAVDTFGRLDVLVNNAGYGDMRPFEQISSEDFKALMDTCFYGVVNLSRAALPVMRDQKSGHIIQISSIGGRLTFAGNTSYHAAKWAVSGFSEALAQETAPFGVRVTALEPGSIKTGFGVRLNQKRAPIIAEYEPSVGALQMILDDHWGDENSSPENVAQVVLRVADSDDVPAHLLVGSDALEMVGKAEAARAADTQRWRDISRLADASVEAKPFFTAAGGQ